MKNWQIQIISYYIWTNRIRRKLVARKIHKLSKRHKYPFVVLNGALLDVKKYESELFGEEKDNGSISYGSLEKATGGTLLIDEISEIPLETQSKF